MSSLPIPYLRPQFFDDNGDPLAGGKLYSFVAGTTTPAATYTDYTGVTPNTNPVILDSAGRAAIFLGSGYYKLILKNSSDVTIWTEDNITWDSLAAQPSLWTTHTITDGQVVTDLPGETVNFALYSSALYEVEIKRGTATFASGQLSVQNVNGTGRVRVGSFMGDNPGVTFTVSQAGQVATLRAAMSTGPGAGTIKLSRRLIPA